MKWWREAYAQFHYSTLPLLLSATDKFEMWSALLPSHNIWPEWSLKSALFSADKIPIPIFQHSYFILVFISLFIFIFPFILPSASAIFVISSKEGLLETFEIRIFFIIFIFKQRTSKRVGAFNHSTRHCSQFIVMNSATKFDINSRIIHLLSFIPYVLSFIVETTLLNRSFLFLTSSFFVLPHSPEFYHLMHRFYAFLQWPPHLHFECGRASKNMHLRNLRIDKAHFSWEPQTTEDKFP